MADAIVGCVSLGANILWPELSALVGVIGFPLIRQQSLKAAYEVSRTMETKPTKCGGSEAGTVPLIANHNITNVAVRREW
jgi:hypothetical protein